MDNTHEEDMIELKGRLKKMNAKVSRTRVKIPVIGLTKALLFTIVFALTTPVLPVEASPSTLEICEEVGMLKGEGGGVTDEYAQSDVTRFQSAIMLLRLKGLEDVAMAYTNGGQYSDVNSTIGWQPGRNMLSYIHDHPDVGFNGYPDGTFNPNGKITGQMFQKLLLETLGYEYGVDYTWSGVIDQATKIGMPELNDEYSKNLTVDDISEATVEALGLKLKGKSDTLAETLNIDESKLEETPIVVGDIRYDFSEFENMTKAENDALYKKTYATDLMRGEYRFPYGLKISSDIYYWDVTSLDDKVIAAKTFLVQKGYFNGEINTDYTPGVYTSQKFYSNDFIDAMNDYQGLVAGQFTPYDFENINSTFTFFIANEQYAMFTPGFITGDSYVETFDNGDAYDIQKAVAPMTVDRLEYMFRQNGGTSSQVSTEYIIYADNASNVYYVTKGKEIISSNIMYKDGKDLNKTGLIDGNSIQSFVGLSDSIKNKAIIKSSWSNIKANVASNEIDQLALSKAV